MILYNLICDKRHEFESWFQTSSAYESQVKRKLVSCPACGSAKVEKAIMAPRIVGNKARGRPQDAPAAPADVGDKAYPAGVMLVLRVVEQPRMRWIVMGHISRS